MSKGKKKKSSWFILIKYANITCIDFKICVEKSELYQARIFAF
jgi:hypothetical protein